MRLTPAARLAVFLVVCSAGLATAASEAPPPRGEAARAALKAYDAAVAEADAAYDGAPAGAERDAAYERRVAAAREALAAGLGDALKAAKDAGAADEAKAIEAEAAEWAAARDTPALEARERAAAARRTLLGVWKIKNGPHEAAWTFLPNGVLRSEQFAAGGQWRLTPGRVVMIWNGVPSWDALDLPLDPKDSSGATHVADSRLEARKIAQPARKPLALAPAPRQAGAEAPPEKEATDPAVLVVPARPPAFRMPADDAAFGARLDELLAGLGGVDALAKLEGPACGERITSIVEGSQGEVLGLRPGDVITTIDGAYPVGPMGVRRLRADREQAMTVVRGGVSHALVIQPGKIGFDGERIYRPELVYLRQGPRDPRWDAFVVAGCAACESDPNLAEAAWAKALAAGYAPDFFSDFCGMLIAWEQGRTSDAIAHAALLETRAGEFPELGKEDFVSRAAVGDFKLAQALARRMTANPGPRGVEGPAGDLLERMLETHRSLPPARRTGPSPSEMAERLGRASLLGQMEAGHAEIPGIDAWRPEVVKWFATNPEPYAASSPTGHYLTHVQVPTVNAADVELIARVVFREADAEQSEWDKVLKIGLVSADRPEFVDVTAPVTPNLINVQFSLNDGMLPGVCRVEAGSEEGADIQSLIFDPGRAARDGFTVRLVHAGEREEVWVDDRRIAYVPSLERPRRVGFIFAIVGVDMRISVKFNKLGNR